MADRYTRKKLVTDAPYQRSRAAEREIYGARSIEGSSPFSVRSGTGVGVGERPMKGGLTPETSWRGFFDRPAPIVPGGGFTPDSEMGKMFKVGTGTAMSDPSQSFRAAGAPPIGGPATGRSNLTTPTAMQYYQEGIKGAGGTVDFGKDLTPSGFFTSTPYGPIGASNTPKDAGIADFFKRYRRA